MSEELWASVVHLARQCETLPAPPPELTQVLEMALEATSENEALQIVESLLPWPSGAEVVGEALLRRTSNPTVVLRLGHWFWMLGNDTLLEQALDQARTLLPADQPELLHLRAQTLPDPADRLAAYQQIIELHPQDRAAWEAILGLTR